MGGVRRATPPVSRSLGLMGESGMDNNRSEGFDRGAGGGVKNIDINKKTGRASQILVKV